MTFPSAGRIARRNREAGTLGVGRTGNVGVRLHGDDTSTDEQLLRAWRGGDRTAGSDLIDRYFEAIARFFSTKAPREQTVQDELVQMTFASCVEAKDRFRGDGSFRSFLYSIAYNVLRKFYTAQRSALQLDFGTVSVVDFATGPSTFTARKAEHALLRDCLQRLPVEQQTVLELHYWEGLTTSETATALGLPLGTAKTRIRTARIRLGETLALAKVLPSVRDAANRVVEEKRTRAQSKP